MLGLLGRRVASCALQPSKTPSIPGGGRGSVIIICIILYYFSRSLTRFLPGVAALGNNPPSCIRDFPLVPIDGVGGLIFTTPRFPGRFLLSLLEKHVHIHMQRASSVNLVLIVESSRLQSSFSSLHRGVIRITNPSLPVH